MTPDTYHIRAGNGLEESWFFATSALDFEISGIVGIWLYLAGSVMPGVIVCRAIDQGSPESIFGSAFPDRIDLRNRGEAEKYAAWCARHAPETSGAERNVRWRRQT